MVCLSVCDWLSRSLVRSSDRQSELELERIAKAAEMATEEEKQKRETIELQARRRQQIIEHHDKIERQRNEVVKSLFFF